MVVDVAGCAVGLYYYVDVLGISCVVIGLMASMKGNLDIIDFLQRSIYIHMYLFLDLHNGLFIPLILLFFLIARLFCAF